jgi:hypothetical protein
MVRYNKKTTISEAYGHLIIKYLNKKIIFQAELIKTQWLLNAI